MVTLNKIDFEFQITQVV